MTTIFIIILFITQIICFYILALLYTKVSKFDDLEKKQRMLMEEMDNSITAYLAEIKDENDRLINQLNGNVNRTEGKQKKNKTDSVSDEIKQPLEQPSIIDFTTPVIPLNIALKSYGTTKLQTGNVAEAEAQGFEAQGPEAQGLEAQGLEALLEIDERTRALRLHDAGESIEEIAKTLGKGRTEVELILKFR